MSKNKFSTILSNVIITAVGNTAGFFVKDFSVARSHAILVLKKV